MDSILFLLLAQPLRVRFSAFPNFFKKIISMLPRFIDSALLREWTSQLDRTHLVLVGGKLLQNYKKQSPVKGALNNP